MQIELIGCTLETSPQVEGVDGNIGQVIHVRSGNFSLTTPIEGVEFSAEEGIFYLIVPEDDYLWAVGSTEDPYEIKVSVVSMRRFANRWPQSLKLSSVAAIVFPAWAGAAISGKKILTPAEERYLLSRAIS